jgi:hypothetical protein
LEIGAELAARPVTETYLPESTIATTLWPDKTAAGEIRVLIPDTGSGKTQVLFRI